MFDFLSTPVYAMAPQGGGQGDPNGMWMTLVMFGAIILIMYFLMIRPQQKRQKEHNKMLESLKKGDKVVTSSGIYGTISDMDGAVFTLQIAENTKVKFDKAAIVNKVQ